MRDLPVYILVNGILTYPGEARAWTDRGVTWLHNAPVEVQAEKFEYFAGALTRRIHAQRHAEDLAACIRRYEGRELHVIGHSNGCDLILRAVQITRTKLASIHLLAGACEENFDRNGLNELLWRGQIAAVHCYTSPDDEVLKWAARPSRWLLGWAGLGYGLLGLVGPQDADAFRGRRVFQYDRPGFGHSTWFAGEHFAETFRAILCHDHKK